MPSTAENYTPFEKQLLALGPGLDEMLIHELK